MKPINKSDDILFNLQQNENEILIKSSTESNLTLICELKTNFNSNDIKINWFYYKYENERYLKTINRLTKTQTTVKNADGFKLITSKLILNELKSFQFGYYMCSVENYKIRNSFERTFDINLNATYFLQIQCKFCKIYFEIYKIFFFSLVAPNVTVNKNILFANNNDQLELLCEIESNPESIFVWQFNNREIGSNNYKYNITTKIIYKNNDFNELNKISYIQTKLLINSVNSIDFGSYFCKATNVIGEAVETIKIERKRVPDVPKNLSIIKIGANSLVLSWISGSNGGEQQRFLLNINNTINLTINFDQFSSQNEFSNETIEIKSMFLKVNQ